jgi:hypothetical protein
MPNKKYSAQARPGENQALFSDLIRTFSFLVQNIESLALNPHQPAPKGSTFFTTFCSFIRYVPSCGLQSLNPNRSGSENNNLSLTDYPDDS